MKIVAFLALSLLRCIQAQDDLSIISLDADSFKEMLDDPATKWFDLIVDVRSLAEFESGHIEGATLMENLASFGSEQQIATPEDLAGCEFCNIAVYCRSGARASAALRILIDAGFVGRLYNAQGVSQWTQVGYPLVTDSESVTPPCTVDPAVSEQCELAYLAYTGGSLVTTMPSAAPKGPVSSPVQNWGPTTWTSGTPQVSSPVAAPTADAIDPECELNNACMALNLIGLCCPTTNNTFLECCNVSIESSLPNEVPTSSPFTSLLPSNVLEGSSSPSFSMVPSGSEFPTVNATQCNANSRCAEKNLTGECCPTVDGLYLDCCNGMQVTESCQTNNACDSLGLTGACCPTTDGFGHLDCCNAFPDECLDNATNCEITSALKYMEMRSSGSAISASDNSFSYIVSSTWGNILIVAMSLYMFCMA